MSICTKLNPSGLNKQQNTGTASLVCKATGGGVKTFNKNQILDMIAAGDTDLQTANHILKFDYDLSSVDASSVIINPYVTTIENLNLYGVCNITHGILTNCSSLTTISGDILLTFSEQPPSTFVIINYAPYLSSIDGEISIYGYGFASLFNTCYQLTHCRFGHLPVFEYDLSTTTLDADSLISFANALEPNTSADVVHIWHQLITFPEEYQNILRTKNYIVLFV